MAKEAGWPIPAGTDPDEAATVPFPPAVATHISASCLDNRAMPNRFLCPRCRGQRSISCNRCGGSGKWLIAGITIGKCKECDGTGRHRCDVCGGIGEIEADSSEPRGA